MNFHFDNKTEKFLKIITENAQNQSIRVFFVGGIVRDNILKIDNSDIDLLLEGNAIEFCKTLPEEIKIKSMHSDFNTAKLSYNGLEIDIASSRIETYPFSNCLPQVVKTAVSIEEDYLRRDFTINSMYCEITIKDNILNYQLIDLANGLADINDKILRVLHNKSYIDDNTRIIRGLDFKRRFGFDFSIQDKNLIKEALSNIEYINSTFDRSYEVFKKALANDDSLTVFKEIVDNKFYKILSNIDINPNLEIISDIISKFNLSGYNKAIFLLNILLDRKYEKVNYDSKVEYKKLFSKFKDFDLATYYYYTLDSSVKDYLNTKDIEVLINGDDLKKLGYKQGKIFGVIFDKLLECKLNNINSFLAKQQEIDWILERFPKE